MRLAVLTTSYPRYPGDAAGRFVADAVEHVRARGVGVEVVGPEQFRHYGIAYGHGVLGNLRRRPWLALFVPALLAGFVRAARRIDADLVHAHWLRPAGSPPGPASPTSCRCGGPTSSWRAAHLRSPVASCSVRAS